MSEVWKKYEGQVGDGKYPLHQLLGSTEHSGVFLTECAEAEGGKAAIKIISADFPGADLQLSVWKRAKQLTHRNLLRVRDSGRCRLAEMNALYIVMEQAEEDLSQVLPQRALSGDETREMLNPVLDALVYLHGQGFAHGHLKPSNVHAIGDQVKISIDTVVPMGETSRAPRKQDIYDAPETKSAETAAASDIWSLGVTLVEVLTQHAPILPAKGAIDPNISETLPQPFLEIARHALRRDPKQRWTAGEISACLNPLAFAAAATGSVAVAAPTISPLSVPLSREPAVPLAKLPAIPEKKKGGAQATSGAKSTILLPNYAMPLLLGVAIVLLGIFALPKLLRYRYVTPATSSTAPQPARTPPKSTDPPLQKVVSKGTKAAVAEPPKVAIEKKPAEKPSQVAAVPAIPAPATLRTDSITPEATAKPAKTIAGRGEVLDQVLPDVPEKARATIHGTIHVVVKVQVNPAGSVSEAELDTAGPSKYFADLALKAARRWEFSSPEAEGHSLPSEWLIRFEFSQADTKAFASQTTP